MDSTTNPLGSGATPLLTERSIVIVDDDATLLSLTSSYLRRLGATVHAASNGCEALALLESLHAAGTVIDAVLCDLRMAGGSGMELHRQVGERFPLLLPRMIFSSGDVDGDDVRSFIDRPDITVLAKPYPLAELRRRLTEFPPPP